ncbi:hypothetical protein QFZ79_003726 [Arthrobacter sp. V4I6]|uniref:hypothetical protein n=1 Tax=unclassified Arthrobacter TaxID=235627 RepID=UPI002781B780|nr:MULTISPECIES: hypothetical protein [unclassified Arthrobacter]MDQ0821351.1 hypothetical protein [Arthrobacter sp. V1I7]MDQ0855615.1 hypothetical protein [Arthrobacter sp. V4I6]
MDILSGVSGEWLRALTWVAAIASGLLLGFWRPRRAHVAALGSVLVFAVANIGAGIYVLSHLGDSRWGGGAEDRLGAPSLADTPVVGQFLGSLDTLLRGVVDGVNEFTDFRAALPVALEFLAAAGWALVVAVPLGILALIVSYREAQRRKAEFARYSLQVEVLSAELDDIKRHLGYPNPG